MNSDGLLLRTDIYAPLTTLSVQLTSANFDSNMINIYKDLELLNQTNGVDAYNPATVYDNATIQFATYDGRLWQWINGSAGFGVTPVEGANWTEVFPAIMAHRKNSDTILDEGGANEISAAAIVTGLAAADATTDLAVTARNAVDFILTSSTGANATIPQATQFLAGLLEASDKIKLDKTSGTNSGDQTLASLGAEDVLNKATDFTTINDTLYPSVNAVAAYVNATIGTGINIATSDLTIADAGTRKLLMNGALATDILTFRNSADTKDILAVYGDEKVKLHEAYFMPTADGTVGQVLQTDGAGNLTFASPTGSNIGTSDLTIGSAGDRKLILGGSLATDTFKIRNSADTIDIFKVQGDRSIVIGQNSSAEPRIILDPGGSSPAGFHGGTSLGLVFLASADAQFNVSKGLDVIGGAGADSLLRFRNGQGGVFSLYYGGVQNVGTAETYSTATKFWATENGTAPTIDYADKHSYYSADESAGNACPHFRTESSQIIKLFSGAALTAIDATALDGTIGTNDTITDNLRTRLNELEARLQAHGLIL